MVLLDVVVFDEFELEFELFVVIEVVLEKIDFVKLLFESFSVLWMCFEFL